MPALSRPLLLVLALAAVACGDNKVTPTTDALTVTPAALDFPRTRVGERATAAVVVENPGRVSRTVPLRITAPFTLERADLWVEGRTTLTVGFAPTEPGEFHGELVIDEALTVTLTGRALHPTRVCTPTLPCRTARFDDERGECVEVVEADGTACAPVDACHATSSCQGGVCVGAPLDCDDHDACTGDRCEPTTGCAHDDLATQCTAPECQVPLCVAATGCGVANQPDLTACSQGRVCKVGACVACASDPECGAGKVCLQGACERGLRVRALIDGISELVLSGDQLGWHHLSWAAPGRQAGQREPTWVDQSPWSPTWPDQPDAENRDCQCSSSTTTVAPALAAQPQSVQVLRVEARGELRAVEPTAANGHQYRLTFDDGFVPDGGLVGSAWYEVVLKYQ